MSRDPKSFKDVLDHIEAEIGDAPSAATGRGTLDTLEREFRNIWTTLEGLGAAGAAETARDEVEARVKASPWLALGAVGLVGLVLGYLFGRARGSK